MEAIEELLGGLSLPNLRYLAGMLERARLVNRKLLWKTDVSAAFMRLRLAPETAMLHAVQVGELILIPLVMQFGWVAAPLLYSVLSSCVNWAHNGSRDQAGLWVPGVSPTVLDEWKLHQNVHVPARPQEQQISDRSMTYVDDTTGPTCYAAAEADMSDVEAIIRHLMGSDAVNETKTEGPVSTLTIIGWHSDMESGRMRPSDKGLKKMFWWIFRGSTRGSKPGVFAIQLKDLRKLVGILRWYSAVIPFASTYALQGLLTAKERVAAGTSKAYQQLVNIRSEAAQELLYWRWILGQGLQNAEAWSAPMWFLAKMYDETAMVDMFTDASSLIGGGHALAMPEGWPHPEAGHYGQFRWSDEEKQWLGIDINVMEFVTAILAIVMERDALANRVVRLQVDNTAAVAWLNKLRSSHGAGQVWVALLTQTLLDYHITLVCVHIKGVLNVVADNMQEMKTALDVEGYLQTAMPEWAYREQI